MTSKEFDHPKYQALRDEVAAETNSNIIQPISFEVYRKTTEEKAQIKFEKFKHKQAMVASYGKNWRKHNNPII